jgi:hypothetical protein
MQDSLLTLWKLLLSLKVALWQHPSFTLILISFSLFAISAALQRVGRQRTPSAVKPSQIAFADGRGELR